MLLRFLLPIVWMGIIFLGSSIPASNIPGAPSIVSYVVHFFEYSILAYLIAHAIKPIGRINLQQSLFILLFIVLFGLFDETHQLFVVGREFSLLDLITDVAGVLIGLAVMYFFQKHQKSIHK